MRLTVATKEQCVVRDHATFAAWGGPLTIEQYLARELCLRSHPWTTRGMRTWLLRDADANGAVLASCETFASTSVLQGEAGAASGTTHAVASVYTEPLLRGRGHAGVMMQQLVARLEKESGVHATTLFSDVGASLYERAGYVTRPSNDRVIAAEAGVVSEGVDSVLTAATLPEHVPSAPHARFVVWPDAEQLDWHLERERVYADLLGRPRRAEVGATAGNGTIVWSTDVKSERLMVLLLAASSRDEVVALVRAAAKEAHARGAREARLWADPSIAALFPADLGRVEVRTGSLPMVRPIDPRVRAEDLTHIPRGTWV